MLVGDKTTSRKLKKAGYTMCPMPGRRDFSYWFNGTQWIKVVDNTIKAIFDG